MIESTINAKTRGIAIRELRFCVESRGLNGIGKKGLQVQAKSFSEENLLENKGFHLDLIQAIILKMNGDINKYFKICGSTALSRKSKDLMEERMAKVQKTSLENDNSKFSLIRRGQSIGSNSLSPLTMFRLKTRKKVLRRRRPQKLQMAHLSFHSEQSKQILLQNRPLLYLQLDDLKYHTNGIRQPEPQQIFEKGFEVYGTSISKREILL